MIKNPYLKGAFCGALVLGAGFGCYKLGQAHYEAALMDDVIGNRNVLTITFDNVRLYSSTPTASMKDGVHKIVDEALAEFFTENQKLAKEPSHGYSHEPKALRATCDVGGCKMRP